MPAKKADPRAVFKPYGDQLDELQKTLQKRPWASDWKIESGLYGDDKVRGASLRMYKPAWTSDIHFECWIGNADIERSSVSLAFHVECPMDPFGIKRGEFSRILLEEGGKKMKDWEGFALSPKSFQTFKRHVPFKEGTVAQALKPEFEKLTKLGSVIDKALNLG